MELERFLDGGSDVVSAICFLLDAAGMLMPLDTLPMAVDPWALAAIIVVFKGFIEMESFLCSLHVTRAQRSDRQWAENGNSLSWLLSFFCDAKK